MFFNYLFSFCVFAENQQSLDRTELGPNMELESGADNALTSTGLVCVRRSRYKRVLFVLLILTIVLSATVISGVLLSSYEQEETPKSPVSSPLTSYISLEDSVDPSIDPCNDFYSFACGHWENASHLVDTEASFVNSFAVLQEEVDDKLHKLFTQTSVSDDFPEILNNAILYYKTCVDAEQGNITYSQSLNDVFEIIGGWPLILGDKWNDTAFDWPLASAHLMKMLGIQSGFAIGIANDFEDTSQNLLGVKPPKFSHETVPDLIIILNCVVRIINPSLIYEQIDSEVTKMASFEHELRQIAQTQDQLKNAKMSIYDLQQEIQTVNWLSVLQTFTNDILCPSKCLTEDDNIIVYDIATLKSVIAFIDNENYSKRDIANFFGWLIVVDLHAIIPGMLKKYGEYFKEYDNELLHTVVEDTCYGSVKHSFWLALDYLFIKEFSYFDLKDGEKLVHFSKKAFRKLIVAADWLDNETRSGILTKLSYMFDVVGYPKFYFSKEQLDLICTKFPVMGNDTIRNYVESVKFFTNIERYKLKLANTYENYVLPRPITHVSAYYDLNRNAIIFPLSIQNPPFFFLNGPWYLNFGAIGAVIGHEINHGFDKTGHRFDRTGSLANWWSNASIEKFNHRLSCFKEQYDRYEYDDHGILISINGTNTLSENMADSSGLRQAYLAYKLWESEHGKDRPYPGLGQYTPDQMFFISFASLWCSKPNENYVFSYPKSSSYSPPRLRVIGSVSNSKDFARAFNCPTGSPMNPQEKCILW